MRGNYYCECIKDHINVELKAKNKICSSGVVHVIIEQSRSRTNAAMIPEIHQLVISNFYRLFNTYNIEKHGNTNITTFDYTFNHQSLP
jgi:hypothetical protein